MVRAQSRQMLEAVDRKCIQCSFADLLNDGGYCTVPGKRDSVSLWWVLSGCHTGKSYPGALSTLSTHSAPLRALCLGVVWYVWYLAWHS